MADAAQIVDPGRPADDATFDFLDDLVDRMSVTFRWLVTSSDEKTEERNGNGSAEAAANRTQPENAGGHDASLHSTFVVLRLAGRRGYFPVGGPA